MQQFLGVEMISRHFSLLTLRHPCKELSSHGCLNSSTGGREFLVSLPGSVFLMKCAVRNLVRTTYTTLLVQQVLLGFSNLVSKTSGRYINMVFPYEKEGKASAANILKRTQRGRPRFCFVGVH